MSDSNSETATSPFDPAAVAVGLLRNDLAFLPFLAALLCISAVLDVLTYSASDFWRASVVVIDRLMQIAVVSIIVLRWRRLLQTPQAPKIRTSGVVFRIAVVSVAASIVLSTPFFGIALSRNVVGALAFLGLFVLGLVWCLRVYLFYAVAGMLGLPVGASFARAVEISRSNTKAILRSLVAPVALTVVCSALFLMPYPDGRSLAGMAASSACEGIFSPKRNGGPLG
jgi:hypothetical protein